MKSSRDIRLKPTCDRLVCDDIATYFVSRTSRIAIAARQRQRDRAADLAEVVESHQSSAVEAEIVCYRDGSWHCFVCCYYLATLSLALSMSICMGNYAPRCGMTSFDDEWLVPDHAMPSGYCRLLHLAEPIRQDNCAYASLINQTPRPASANLGVVSTASSRHPLGYLYILISLTSVPFPRLHRGGRLRQRHKGVCGLPEQVRKHT